MKKYESGVIKDPITVSPDMTIRQVLELTRSRGISGVPVVLGKKVVGIVTHRDLRFEEKLDAPVSSVMTPKERLITVRENAPKHEVLGLLHKHRIEKVLVVNGDHELAGMITVKDFQKATEFPRACKDERGPPARWRGGGHWCRYARPGRGASRRGRGCRGGGYGARPSRQHSRYRPSRQERAGATCRSSPATSQRRTPRVPWRMRVRTR